MKEPTSLNAAEKTESSQFIKGQTHFAQRKCAHVYPQYKYPQSYAHGA